MPRFDGTGPLGQGSMTGGGRGRCVAGARPFVGHSFYGKGIGRGFRNCFYATGLPGWMRAQRGMQALGDFSGIMSKEEELVMLKEQTEFLEQELGAIKTRINDLESLKKSENK